MHEVLKLGIWRGKTHLGPVSSIDMFCNSYLPCIIVQYFMWRLHQHIYRRLAVDIHYSDTNQLHPARSVAHLAV